jgi:hypothetical protein
MIETLVERVFLTHPCTVGETYLEHLRSAFGFAGGLFLAAGACALHAVVPAVCERTGSRMIAALYDRMVANRHRAGVKAEAATRAPSKTTQQPWADYAI